MIRFFALSSNICIGGVLAEVVGVGRSRTSLLVWSEEFVGLMTKKHQFYDLDQFYDLLLILSTYDFTTSQIS